MGKVQTLHFKHFKWINIVKAGESEVKYLSDKFCFHPLDLHDCVNTTHRSKVDFYQKYSFIVLLFPVYNRTTREITPVEIHFFISKNFLITVSDGDLAVFNNYFSLAQLSEEFRKNFTDNSPEKLLYEILNKLITYCLPMIDHLIVDCDNIEKAIFDGHEKRMVSEILITRRNITDFRRIMQVHKSILHKTIDNFKNSQMFLLKKTDIYFDNLIDYTKEIWDALESLKERIEALYQTNESLISFKLNSIMRILTIISVVTFPLTLIAAIFGMNVSQTMPLINHPFGFWIIIAIMFTVMALMLVIFRKKKFL